jgi:hypothetical protein
MANFSEFLGGLASGFSDARVNSDVQSLKIAEEYAKNDLLKHFSVPRMRIDKVELNIPIAVGGMAQRAQRTFRTLNQEAVLAKTMEVMLGSMNTERLSAAAWERLRLYTKDQIALADAKMRENRAVEPLEEFTKIMSIRTRQVQEQTYDSIVVARQERLRADTIQLNEFQLEENMLRVNETQRLDRIRQVTDLNELERHTYLKLQDALKEEFLFNEMTEVLDYVDVVVEHDRLKEIAPQNIIMVKMTLSEQGMEWVSMEDADGNAVPRLLPE